MYFHQGTFLFPLHFGNCLKYIGRSHGMSKKMRVVKEYIGK